MVCLNTLDVVVIGDEMTLTDFRLILDVSTRFIWFPADTPFGVLMKGARRSRRFKGVPFFPICKPCSHFRAQLKKCSESKR